MIVTDYNAEFDSVIPAIAKLGKHLPHASELNETYRVKFGEKVLGFRFECS